MSACSPPKCLHYADVIKRTPTMGDQLQLQHLHALSSNLSLSHGKLSLEPIHPTVCAAQTTTHDTCRAQLQQQRSSYEACPHLPCSPIHRCASTMLSKLHTIPHMYCVA
eukprot:GHRQ01026874.1.p2 GENE.GHRQ01026874.1~~GHRQ01026874.1.p2  ORF type:complete len:109 (-),score=0.87 GHRQ01026874.1:1138-1464(-)